MPITVFDAVGKFHADTTDLDSFVVKLERGLTTASEKAAASTQLLKAAQDEFRASIAAVSAQGGDTADNLTRLAEAEKNLTLAAAAAKQEHAALKQQLLETKEASGVGAEAMGQLTGKLGQMFGILAVAEGFKSLIVGTQQSVLNLDLLSQKTGIAIGTLAGIEHVSKAAGVSFEQVGTALTRLSRAQALAIEGGKAQVTAFERIGISANELKALSPEQLFYRVADAMANAKNHAEANASAFALLGRGGAELIPIFKKGGEALHKMVDEAAAASGVTKEAGQAAREWEAQTANLSEVVRSLFIPVMGLAVREIRFLEQAGANWALEFGQIATIIHFVSEATIEGLRGMGAVLQDALHGNWSAMVADGKLSMQLLQAHYKGANEFAKTNAADTAEYIKKIWTDVDPLKPFKDDLSDLGKGGKDLTSAMEEAAKKQIAIDESLEMSKIKRWAADAKYQAAFSKDAADLILKIQQEEADKEYQLKLLTLQKERLAEEQAARGYLGAGDTEKYQKQLDEIAQTNAKVEALDAEHYAKEKQLAAQSDEALLKLRADWAVAAATLGKSLFPNLPEDTRNLLSMEQAAARLGVTLSADLGKTAEQAKEALALLDKEYKAGLISLRDFEQAQMKALEAQIAYDTEMGKAPALVKAEEKELDALKKKFDDAYGKPGQSELTKFFDLFHRKSKEGQKDSKDLETAVENFTHQVTQAYATAIMGALQSGQSIGAALEKATKQILLQLATQALAQAIYCTAMGMAELALGVTDESAAEWFAAAAEFGLVAGATGAVGLAMPGGSGSGAPGQNTRNPAGLSPTQSSFSGGGSQQTTGVTHLAAGGVIVAGEAGPEAVLPLDDRRALDRITGALSAALVRSPGANLLLSRSTMAAAGAAMARAPGGTASALPESPGEFDARMGRIAEQAASRVATAGPGAMGDVHLHFPNVKTILSPKAFLKEIEGPLNRMVQNRQITINASNSLRLTRRSQ